MSNYEQTIVVLDSIPSEAVMNGLLRHNKKDTYKHKRIRMTTKIQGIECVEGYKAIERSSYFGSNLNRWFTSTIPLGQSDLYKENKFSMSVDQNDEIMFDIDVHKCYIPVDTTKAKPQNEKPSMYTGNTIYISEEIVNVNSRNLKLSNVEKEWDILREDIQDDIIRYNIKDLDIERLWNKLTDTQREYAVQFQVFNLDIDKHWHEFSKYEVNLACVFQIYNFNIEKHEADLTDAQIESYYKNQTHHIVFSEHVWKNTPIKIRTIICENYCKTINTDYEKVGDTWCAVLPS